MEPTMRGINSQHLELLYEAVQGWSSYHAWRFIKEYPQPSLLKPLLAVKLGIDMQWPKIIIEGDSLSIIKKCNAKGYDK